MYPLKSTGFYACETRWHRGFSPVLDYLSGTGILFLGVMRMKSEKDMFYLESRRWRIRMYRYNDYMRRDINDKTSYFRTFGRSSS